MPNIVRMDRLSTMDASFLRVETPTAHMHVGWRSAVDLPAGAERFDTALLTRRIAERLHLLPRFRQRIVRTPFGVAEPVWSDDPYFDVADHVREAPAGAPLQSTADDFLSRPLDDTRPLWEILVIPRTGPGRATVLGKVHHAMVDGVAAVELGMLMFDIVAEPAPVEPPAGDRAWNPAPVAGPARLAAGAVTDTALSQFRAAGRAVALGRSPARTVRVADTLRRAALSLAEDTLNPAPASPLNVEIGPARTLLPHAVELSRLLHLKQTFGVKLGDVVHAVCAGALRSFALRRGETPADLRIMVPVNVRGEGDAASAGNDITFAFVALPVSLPTARERMNAVVAAMDEVKASGKIAGTSALLGGLGALPAPLKDRAARLAASPRLYNLTISNVPGPRIPLYAAGARVRSIVPVIPVPDRHALSIGVLTYDGHAHFGFYADPEALARTGTLPLAVEDAVAELEAAAGRALSAPAGRRAGSRGSAATRRTYRAHPAPASSRSRPS